MSSFPTRRRRFPVVVLLGALALAALLASPVVAVAQEVSDDCVVEGYSEVCPSRQEITRDEPVEPAQQAGRGAELPFTGANLVLFVATGAALVGTGRALMLYRRSHKADA